MSDDFIQVFSHEALRALLVTAGVGLIYTCAALLSLLLDKCRWLSPPEKLVAQVFGVVLLGTHLWMMLRVAWSSVSSA